jgi:hypothetical protein
LDESASHGRTEMGDCAVIRARPAEAAVLERGTRAAAGCAGVRLIRGVVASAEGTDDACRGAPREGRLFGGGDSVFEPPSAKTWSSLAVPPFEDVGVPPEVIAMYCFPFTE